jgi:type IV pilus assembly protein PilN
MPRINLLPWREQQRAERKKAFGVGMIGSAVGALAVAAIGLLLVNQAMGAQTDRNNSLKREISVLDKQIEEINSLEQQKQQFIARMRIIETLQRSRPEIVHVFDTFTRIIPDGVYLTSLRQQGSKFTIQGISQSPARVSSFMRAINDSEWLTNPAVDVVQATRGGGQSANFTLQAQQVSAQAATQANK